jgi:hypothetical protein
MTWMRDGQDSQPSHLPDLQIARSVNIAASVGRG